MRTVSIYYVCALALALALAWAVGSAFAQSSEKPVWPAVGSPVTHSDWMLHNPAPAWGPQGVHQILDRCRECGWKRVYWRVFDGGRACYPSKLMEPLHGFDEDNYHKGRDTEALVGSLKQYDWGSFDAVAEAIAYGHRIGLEVHLWLTINEDDHGWGLQSRFSHEHPEYRWVRRDGRPFRSQLSFAFEPVREYKLSLVREILAYKPDGLLFDWIRTGDVRDNPQTDSNGVAVCGYEQPNLERFHKEFGEDVRALPNGDERWVRVRCEPQTQFMREVHNLVRGASTRIRMPIAVLVQQPWGYRGAPNDTPYKDNLHGLLLDVRTWAEEELVDEVFGAGYYRPGGSPELAFDWLKKEVGSKIDVGLFGWIGSPDQFRADTQLARRLGATTLLLWESDYIGLPPANPETVKAMAEHSQQSTQPVQH